MGNEDSDSLIGGSGADTFIQENGASATVGDLQTGNNFTITFNDPPDVITDFQATNGDTEIVDQVAFEDWDGGFNNNLGSATGGFGDNNVVLYSGSFNDVNNTFFTTDNGVGPDVLAFKSNGSSFFLGEGDFGSQSVILLGAAGQGFSAANFEDLA